MIKRSLIPFTLLVFFSSFLFAQTETVYPGGLKAGDMAPDFTAKDQDGNTLSLKERLKEGPVVILFYRGQWCPHCNKQLSHFADSLQLLRDKKVTVLAVTPETADGIRKTIEKTRASFPVLEDAGLEIMKLYKVNFAVDAKTISSYKGYGIDFNKANGANGANLPVPATYIIGTDGKVKYVFFNTDYRKRVSVKDILDNL
ncbi:MAG TPA: peroxiredoxin-like family protein [Ferruginibacter sp.]|nr:peroxiredoxin-like family protein [Ferruginibacter sp.]